MRTLLFDGSYPITSPYGFRVLNGKKEFHDGVDFGMPVGTPIKAPQDGIVHTAGVVDTFNSNSPNLGVLIHARSGVYYTVFHLSKVLVKKGDRVFKGQTIALSGNTGLSTGPHLHFGVYRQPWRYAIDPTNFYIITNTMNENEIIQLRNFYNAKDKVYQSQLFTKLEQDEQNAFMSWDGDNNDAPDLEFLANRIVALRQELHEQQNKKQQPTTSIADLIPNNGITSTISTLILSIGSILLAFGILEPNQVQKIADPQIINALGAIITTAGFIYNHLRYKK